MTDQRHRLALSWIGEPQPFGREHNFLARVFNDWKISGVVTVVARWTRASLAILIRMANTSNDRLPGYGRNAFLGPDYATTDLRLTRRPYVTPRLKLELVAEAFNTLNRDNRRVVITDDGFTSTATDFTQVDKTIGINHFPAYYRRPADLTAATRAYAPRQLQLALRFIFQSVRSRSTANGGGSPAIASMQVRCDQGKTLTSHLTCLQNVAITIGSNGTSLGV